MVTAVALAMWTDLIKNTLNRSRFLVNGEEIEREFFKLESSGSEIKILIYLTDEDIGKIEDIEVIAEDGTVLLRKPDTIIKDQTEGLIIGFILEMTSSEFN